MALLWSPTAAKITFRLHLKLQSELVDCISFTNFAKLVMKLIGVIFFGDGIIMIAARRGGGANSILSELGKRYHFPNSERIEIIGLQKMASFSLTDLSPSIL